MAAGWLSLDRQFEPYLGANTVAPSWCGLGCRSRTLMVEYISPLFLMPPFSNPSPPGLSESRIARIARRPKQPNRANREALYHIAELRILETFFCLCGEMVQHRFSNRIFCLLARVRTPTTLFLFVTFCFCVSGFMKFNVV
jgi:hypothetical protein